MKPTESIEFPYRNQGGIRYQHETQNASNEAYHFVAQNRRFKFQPYIAATDQVLEFGAGSGWNIAKVTAAGKVGYDLSTSVAPLLKQQNIIFTDSVTDIPACTFDVVICHHVLEHVANPVEVLATIQQKLKPNAKLLLCVPYEVERRYRVFRPEDPNFHLYSWNVQTLCALVVRCGYTIVEAGVRPFGYERFAAELAVRWHIPFWGYRLLLHALRLIRPCREVMVVAEYAPSRPR